MSIPIDFDRTQSEETGLASVLFQRLIQALDSAKRAQTDNESNIYNVIVNIPSINKALQEAAANVQAATDINAVLAELNKLLPSDTALTEVQRFVSAFDGLANDIEANATLFIHTINATTKRGEFVTPVPDSVKTAITNRVNAVLAEVS